MQNTQGLRVNLQHVQIFLFLVFIYDLYKEYLLQMRIWTIICVFKLLQLIAAEFGVVKGLSFRRMNTIKPMEGY